MIRRFKREAVDLYGDQEAPEPVVEERSRLRRGERDERGYGLCRSPRCPFRHELVPLCDVSGYCATFCCLKISWPGECQCWADDVDEDDE